MWGVGASIRFHLQRLLTNFSKLHIRLRRVSRYFKCRPCRYRVCCLFNYVSDLYGRRSDLYGRRRAVVGVALHEAHFYIKPIYYGSADSEESTVRFEKFVNSHFTLSFHRDHGQSNKSAGRK